MLFRSIIRLSESDLVRIIERVINEGVTQKVVNKELSSWLSFKLGPKVLSGDFVCDGSWVTFNGKRYSKPVFNGNKEGTGTWEKSMDSITFKYK